jgi:hypothetical protein
MGRLMRCQTLLLLTTSLFILGCSSTLKPIKTQATPDAAPAAPANTGRIDVDCEPGEAQVVVDEQPRGSANEIVKAGGLQLSRGHHRIEIKHEGYHPFRFELILGNKTETIKVRLRATGKRP